LAGKKGVVNLGFYATPKGWDKCQPFRTTVREFIAFGSQSHHLQTNEEQRKKDCVQADLVTAMVVSESTDDSLLVYER